MKKFEISKKRPETATHDVMGGDARREIKIHEHGLVALCDVMPRICPAGKTADFAIIQAARVSYGDGTKQVNEDRGLIRYLMRMRHTTPLEMVEFKFHFAMPIFVARQFIRHRTANVNEYSARYSVVKDRFFRPDKDEVREQSATNKQGSGKSIHGAHVVASDFLEYLDRAEALYTDYEKAIEGGVAREMARIGLPLSVYTEWYWKIDAHNLFHFLSLRMDKHAQQEIRDYADAMFALIEPIIPVACEAFLDYRLNAMTLSALEIEAVRSGQPLGTENKREQDEWEAKKIRLGIGASAQPGG